MFVLRLKLKAAELLLFCLCLTTLSGRAPGHETGPAVVQVVAEEGSDAILPCSLSTKENIEWKLFDWKKDGPKEVFLYDASDLYNNGRPGQDKQFKGRVSHFKDELKHGNASIIITNTKMADSGTYTCVFPRLQPKGQIFYISLVVGCDQQCSALKNKYGKTDGAAPEPCIAVVDVTEFGVKLKCDVRGAFPRPKVEWEDSDGNILPVEEPQVSKRGDRYDIALQTTVTKTTTNCFRCVVTQEDIGHMIGANITVPEKLFEDTSSKVDVTGWFLGGIALGAALGALALAVVLALLVAAKFITIQRYKGSCQKRDAPWKDPSEKALNSQPV